MFLCQLSLQGLGILGCSESTGKVLRNELEIYFVCIRRHTLHLEFIKKVALRSYLQEPLIAQTSINRWKIKTVDYVQKAPR